VQHTSRSELFQECRILWIIGEFRLFFRVEVIEIAEELIESVDGRQEFIPIAEMVLAELAGRIAERRVFLRRWMGLPVAVRGVAPGVPLWSIQAEGFGR
jgi:hypothetical protein